MRNKKKVLIILICTLVTGAIANYVMQGVGLAMYDYNQELLRRSGRKTRTRREDQLTPLM